MHTHAAPPRLGFVITVVVLLFGYFMFARGSVDLLLGMRGEPQTLTAVQQLPQTDFGLFWCAGKGLMAKAAQHLGLAGPDPAYQQICQLDILAADAQPASAWPYPPPAGFWVVPLAALPLALSFWIWRAFSLILGALLLRGAGLGWTVTIAGLASPAGLHDMTCGQNGTVTGALLTAALLLAARRPAVAGALGGVLALKPQIILVFPAIIWRRGGARLVLAGAITVLLLVLASLAVWGVAQWSWFLRISAADELRSAAAPFSAAFPSAGITVYYMARSFGAAPALAWKFQDISAGTALLLIWAAWRPGRMAEIPRMAFTASLGVLAMPHGFAYDLVAFSTGMAALFFRAGEWERLVLALLWLMGGYTITVAGHTGLVLFPLWAMCGAAMAWRLRAGADQ